jgi:hypothetical protein
MTGVTATECCEACGASNADVELFGYRRLSGWRWFCAEHRLGRSYADKRSPALDNNGGDGEQAA